MGTTRMSIFSCVRQGISGMTVSSSAESCAAIPPFSESGDAVRVAAAASAPVVAMFGRWTGDVLARTGSTSKRAKRKRRGVQSSTQSTRGASNRTLRGAQLGPRALG